MPLPFDSDQLPAKYKTHLPADNTDSLREAGDFMAEPFIGAGKRIKESLTRIYKVAAQSMTGEPIRPLPREEAPVEYFASIAARIIALPLVMMKEVVDIGTAARTGAGTLRGGPRGELGEWTPEQYQVAAAATMTAAIGVGAGGGSATPAAIGRGEAYKMLAKDFRFIQGVAKSASEKKVFREIAKGFHKVPQEILDPIKKVKLYRGGKKAELGAFSPGKKELRFKIDQPAEGALSTVGHEFIHAEQFRKTPSMFKLKSKGKYFPEKLSLVEKHAYASEKGFVATVKALPKGERITKEVFDKIYQSGLKALRARKIVSIRKKGGKS